MPEETQEAAKLSRLPFSPHLHWCWELKGTKEANGAEHCMEQQQDADVATQGTVGAGSAIAPLFTW